MDGPNYFAEAADEYRNKRDRSGRSDTGHHSRPEVPPADRKAGSDATAPMHYKRASDL